MYISKVKKKIEFEFEVNLLNMNIILYWFKGKEVCYKHRILLHNVILR